MTQEHLAIKADLNKSYISRLETDHRDVSPTLTTIKDIAKALDICPTLLLPCNCASCSIKNTEIEKLKCKQKVLALYSKAIDISSRLVEYELDNFNQIDKKNLSYGDSKYMRDNKLIELVKQN